MTGVVSSHKALNCKLRKLVKQERRERKKLVSRNERLKNELKAAQETIERLEGAVQGITQAETQSATQRKEKN